MASSSHRAGGALRRRCPYRSSDGLSTRAVAGSDEIQLRIDPTQSDFDDEITGLRSQVRQLRNVAEEIGSEAKFQKDFIDQLQMTLIKAQAGVKNNIRKLNQSIIKSGSNHIVHVVLFALVLFFCIHVVQDFQKIRWVRSHALLVVTNTSGLFRLEIQNGERLGRSESGSCKAP